MGIFEASLPDSADRLIAGFELIEAASPSRAALLAHPVRNRPLPRGAGGSG